MRFLRRYGFYFLLLAILSDFLTPYVLGLFYPGMNQLTMVMSVFGDVASPVQQAFLVWSVVSGILYVLALPAIYQTFAKVSRNLALGATLAIGFYGVGDCIFTGLFSIDSEQATWTLSTWVNNIGSGIGYAGLLIFPLLLVLYYANQGSMKTRRYAVLALVSLLIAGLYGLARLPALAHVPVFDQIGFCQRLSFFFNYLPMVLFSGGNIQTKSKF